jgi:hypothetical protein
MVELVPVEAAQHRQPSRDRARARFRMELVGEPRFDVGARRGEQKAAVLAQPRGPGGQVASIGGERSLRQAVLQPQLVAEGVDDLAVGGRVRPQTDSLRA